MYSINLNIFYFYKKKKIKTKIEAQEKAQKTIKWSFSRQGNTKERQIPFPFFPLPQFLDFNSTLHCKP